ncbi:MAG TPA: Crp/Fnr family transcriptional regulator [Sphingomicrobium sp.]|nr:Crp/Fnr family transcriptional regulator [Sphingomicrobium sp.]
MASRRLKSAAQGVPLRETLISAGLEPHLADLLDDMPQRLVRVEPRRPFREPGAPRDEVMFVRFGILSKFKADPSGRRQIVALRFPGEGILPSDGVAEYGIQAIVRSEVMIGKSEDFLPILDAHPELQRFFWRLSRRNESIGYEWLVNCGRRDSTARVAHLLCETAVRMHAPDGHMLNPFTQQQIADITGQTSVNVNRVLADMERQGLIRRKGREIEFTDWTEIRRVASFQPEYLTV